MARRHYRQFFHTGHPDQSAEDDWRVSGPLPVRLRQGRFRIFWIPSENSADIAAFSRRVIASFATPGISQTWTFQYVGGSGIQILGSGITFAAEPITFSAGDELCFALDGEAGTITAYRVNQRTVNNLTLLVEASGDPWSHLADDTWNCRIGGLLETAGHSARGDVSIPYALPFVQETIGGSDVLTIDAENITLDGEDIEHA